MSMDGMAMPGGWTMSMMWMRMPGQTWLGAATSFVGMWTVMMVVMMLPVWVPMLWRYRRSAAGGEATHPSLAATLVSAGYFLVWIVPAIAVFPLGVTLAAIEMDRPALARAVPMLTGVVVVIAGALQLTRWKARSLARCRTIPGSCAGKNPTAFRHGLSLGLHCARCCGHLMAIPLVMGVMDLGAMGLMAAAIAVERLAPAGERAARLIGAAIVFAGWVLVVRAAAALPS
jgi:predicted metal-binding membrane protein